MFPAGSFGDVANLIADAFFLTECYLNFRTAVSIEGKLVFDTNVIARRYIGVRGAGCASVRQHRAWYGV